MCPVLCLCTFLVLKQTRNVLMMFPPFWERFALPFLTQNRPSKTRKVFCCGKSWARWNGSFSFYFGLFLFSASLSSLLISLWAVNVNHVTLQNKNTRPQEWIRSFSSTSVFNLVTLLFPCLLNMTAVADCFVFSLVALKNTFKEIYLIYFSARNIPLLYP